MSRTYGRRQRKAQIFEGGRFHNLQQRGVRMYSIVNFVTWKQKESHFVVGATLMKLSTCHMKTCDLAAWRKGKQLILQQIFKPSDGKLNSREVLLSAAVAADRAGNERGVIIVKHSGFLKAGIHQRSDITFFCKVWLAFSFQTNFMYTPVV